MAHPASEKTLRYAQTGDFYAFLAFGTASIKEGHYISLSYEIVGL